MDGRLTSKVFNNFFDDFEEFREYLDKLDYTGVVNPEDGVMYPGISLQIPDYFKLQVQLKVGTPKRLFLRLSPEGQETPHQAHNDEVMGKYTFIVYLNRRDHCAGGTSLLKHESGFDRGPCTEDQVEMWRTDTNNPEKWSITRQYDMEPNRAILYPSELFHRSEPIGGFGTDATNARLVMVGFFDDITFP